MNTESASIEQLYEIAGAQSDKLTIWEQRGLTRDGAERLRDVAYHKLDTYAEMERRLLDRMPSPCAVTEADISTRLDALDLLEQIAGQMLNLAEDYLADQPVIGIDDLSPLSISKTTQPKE